MTIYQTGWLCISLEMLLLATWVYSAFYSKNGTDAAGRGMAIFYLLALGGYVLVGILLMLTNNKYAIVVVIALFILPVLVVIYGLVKKFL